MGKGEQPSRDLGGGSVEFFGGDFYGFPGFLGFLGSSWSHLPPPVVLLDDDDGPLLLPSHLQLGDVRLVLPPLPVCRDNDLRVSQLHPVLSGVPPDEDNENGDNAMVGSR